MTVQDLLNLILARTTYITQSLILKSVDDYGVTYKWLEGTISCEMCSGSSMRYEMFVATDYADKDKDITERTTIVSTEVYPAK